MVWANPRSLATTGGIIVYFLFLRVLRCFSSPRSPPSYNGYPSFRQVGCPIRKSPDQRPFAPTRGLSQLVTSFIACESLGIRHTPFTTFARTELASHLRVRNYELRKNPQSTILNPTCKASTVDYTFSFFISYHIILYTILCILYIDMEIRFTFCFRFQYVKERFHLQFDNLQFTIYLYIVSSHH